MANYCPNCGEQIEKGDKYCEECGIELEEGGENEKSGMPWSPKTTLVILGMVIAIISFFLLFQGLTNSEKEKREKIINDLQNKITLEAYWGQKATVHGERNTEKGRTYHVKIKCPEVMKSDPEISGQMYLDGIKEDKHGQVFCNLDGDYERTAFEVADASKDHTIKICISSIDAELFLFSDYFSKNEICFKTDLESMNLKEEGEKCQKISYVSKSRGKQFTDNCNVGTFCATESYSTVLDKECYTPIFESNRDTGRCVDRDVSNCIS